MRFFEKVYTISPSTGVGTWMTVDLSHYLPTTATGVVLMVRVASSQNFGVRPFGSTDNLTETVQAGSAEMFYIGCSERKIQIWVGGAVRTDLVGYVEDECLMFTNSPYHIHTSGASGWVTYDLSAYVSSRAKAAFFIKCSANQASTPYRPYFGARKFGATYDQKAYCNEMFGFMVGLDVDKKCDIYQSVEKASDFYLVGYSNSGIFKDVPEEIVDATSTTSITMGTGSKTFETQAGLAYVPQVIIRIAYDSSHYMQGLCTSYSGTTLVVDVTQVIGSGTYSSWTIGVATQFEDIDRSADPDLPDNASGIIYHILRPGTPENTWYAGIMRVRPEGEYIKTYVLGTDGNIYSCKKSHRSTIDDRPVTGGNWATYWVYDSIPTADTKTWGWLVDTYYEFYTTEPRYDTYIAHGSSIMVCGMRPTLALTSRYNNSFVDVYSFMVDAQGNMYWQDYVYEIGRIFKCPAIGGSPWKSGPQELLYILTSHTITSGAASAESSSVKLVDTTKNFTALGVGVSFADRVYKTSDGKSAKISSISTTTNPNDTLNFSVKTGFPFAISPNFSGGNAYTVQRPDPCHIGKMFDDTNVTDGFFMQGVNYVSGGCNLYRILKNGSAKVNWATSDYKLYSNLGCCFDPGTDSVAVSTWWAGPSYGFVKYSRPPGGLSYWVPSDGGNRYTPFSFRDGRFGYYNSTLQKYILWSSCGGLGAAILLQSPVTPYWGGSAFVDDVNNKVYIGASGNTPCYEWDLNTNTIKTWQFGYSYTGREIGFNPNDGWVYTPNTGASQFERLDWVHGISEGWNGDSGGYGYGYYGGTYYIPGPLYIAQALRDSDNFPERKTKIWILGYTQPPTVPEIELSVATLEQTCYVTTIADPQSFIVTNVGESSSVLNADITEDSGGWLSVLPLITGELDKNESIEIDISYDSDELDVGDYTATITISDDTASNDPQTIAVTLHVISLADRPEMSERMRTEKWFRGTSGYQAGTIYPRNACVLYGSLIYTSLQDDNMGHTPDSSPTWWDLLVSGDSLFYGYSLYDNPE